MRARSPIHIRGRASFGGRVEGSGDEKSRVMQVSKATLTHGMGTTAVGLFRLPAYADIVGIAVDVKTAFSAQTAAVLDLGIATQENRYRNDLDVRGATGQTVTGWSNLGDVGASPIVVTATLAQTGTAATVGTADVMFYWFAD